MLPLVQVRRNSTTLFLSLFGGQSLGQSNVTKFIGVHLDEHLTWKCHINKLLNQLVLPRTVMCQEHLVVSSGFRWFITTVIISFQAHNRTMPLPGKAKDLMIL